MGSPLSLCRGTRAAVCLLVLLESHQADDHESDAGPALQLGYETHIENTVSL